MRRPRTELCAKLRPGRILLTALVFAVLTACSGGGNLPDPSLRRNAGDDPPPSTGIQNDRVPGEYLFTLQAGRAAEELRTSVFEEYQPEIVRPVRENVYLVRFGRDPGIDRLGEIAKRTDFVTAVEPNYLYRSER